MATKNIVPNADSEGGIGTSSKYWATGYIDAITTTGNLVIGGSIDLEGDIDVNGTTNLDIVDIDGAVNMATTALVTGVLTTTAATVFNGGFTSNAASTISTADNLDTLSLISTDADANAGPNLRLFRNSASPADSDVVGLVEFEGKNSAGTTVRWAGIESKIVDVTDSTEDGSLELVTTLAGSGAVSRILMNATETVINESSKDLDFRVESDNLTNAFFVQGSDGNVGIGVTPFPQNLIAGSLDLNGGASIFGYDKRAYLASNVYFQGGWKVKEAGYGAFMLVGLTNGDFGFYTTTQGTSANAAVTDSRSLHISSGGDVTVNTGNLVIGTAGKGIDFTAENTGRLGGSATDRTASILDDYEEGTWTAVIKDDAGTAVDTVAETGRYTKIGRIVNVSFGFKVSDKGSVNGATGINVHGLPFAVNTNTQGSGEPHSGHCGFVNNLTSKDYGGGIHARFNNNSTVIELKYTPGGAVTTQGNDSLLFNDIHDSNTLVVGAGTYEVLA